MAEYTLEEIEKHTSESDCWVILHGRVLDVTEFLPDHPGGVKAIMTFAGRDATEEFDMIHPANVIEKYAPESIIGIVKGSQKAKVEVGNALDKPLLREDKIIHEHSWGDWKDESHRTGGTFFQTPFIGSVFSMIAMFLSEVLKTIFSTSNFKITNDRKGLTRSAIFLIFFQVIHAIGNLHVFLGPDDFNGYGYFYVRLYWTGFGLDANFIEEYLLLAALLHVCVGMKRTYDITCKYPFQTSSSGFGQYNLAISGLFLLMFMTIHLYQFRFAATDMYKVRPPPYLINLNLKDWLRLRLFYTDDESVPQVAVRDIYKLEFDIFSDLKWVLFYCFSVFVFTAHFMIGWVKLVPAGSLGIPKLYHGKIQVMGCLIALFVGACYFSFPLYIHCVRGGVPKLGLDGDF